MAINTPANPMPGMRFFGAGDPTNDSTFLGVAPVGATYQDTTAGTLWMCTVSTSANITWVKQT